MSDQETHSWVTTTWPGILKARGEGNTAQKARNELLVRYHEAVYHYLKLKIKEPSVAEDLYSNFALRLLQSDDLVRRADPQKGRFRNYLKTALHHMVMDHYRGKNRKGAFVPLEAAPHEPVAVDDAEQDFSPIWRQELLNQTWKALEEAETKSGQIHCTVLRCASDHPDLKGPQLAEHLSTQLGKSITPENVRQLLHRARDQFAKLLLEEVERSLENPTLDELEKELIELELLSYCKKSLEARRKG